MLLNTLQNSPAFLISAVFIIGLMVGSFLNVLIYRLPEMMHRSWRRQCLDFLELPAEKSPETFNLSFPGSHCPNCKTAIKALQNIPILSYLFLRGKCSACGGAISARYPSIEAFTAACSVIIAWRFGYSPALIFALLLTWSLIALSFIDIDRQLLPDSITLPMLWLGLILSLFSIFTDSRASIIGAAAGYLSLWSIYQLFKLTTGKQGMGFGDFKLLALFGAWLGWQYLPLIILLSSLAGLVISGSMIILKKHDARQPIPFGPYLAAAGWLALIWGNDLNSFYLQTVGL